MIDGIHAAGSATIKVKDSSNLSADMVIRIGNRTYTIMAVDPATHVVSLDKLTDSELPDSAVVKQVVYPSLLGRYKAEFTANVNIGRYIFVLVDLNGIVNNLEDDLEVVYSLTSGSGKITANASKATLG